METERDVREQISHAFQVERVLTTLGWLVLLIGVLSIASILILWLGDELSTSRAIGAAIGTLLGTVLAGAAAYGSGTNVGLAATRLDLDSTRRRNAGGPADTSPDPS